MAEQVQNVAIIGAGLGGAALATALTSSFPGCSITIFEARSRDALSDISSGVILTPNGLWVLDKLGVLPQIHDKCYISTYRCFKDRNDKTTKKTPTALQEKYGYSNHRAWRKVLLDAMLETLAPKANVKISFNHKLVELHPASTDNVVSFDIINTSTSATVPTTRSADLLIGSDGIYSTVRRLLYPSIQPVYTGTTGLLTHIPRASVAWPYPDYERNATIQDTPGALIFLCEDAEEKDMMVGRQITHLPSSLIQNRAALKGLQSDKSKLLTYFLEHYEEYGPTARKILDAITQHKDQIFIWPYMRMPTLKSWFRETDGRVLILGDAAHAIPASSGQGVNQVLEDVWMLTLLLQRPPTNEDEHEPGVAREGNAVPYLTRSELLERLKFWQESRQKRIDRIYDWATNVQNVARLSVAEREKVEREREMTRGKSEEKIADGTRSGGDEMDWLYRPCVEDAVRRWWASRLGHGEQEEQVAEDAGVKNMS